MGLNVHLNCRPATREEVGDEGGEEEEEEEEEERNNGKYRGKGGVYE